MGKRSKKDPIDRYNTIVFASCLDRFFVAFCIYLLPGLETTCSEYIYFSYIKPNCLSLKGHKGEKDLKTKQVKVHHYP